MGLLSKFEGKMEDTVGRRRRSAWAQRPMSPVQIAKKAEKQMRREKMVGAGKQYAPTLYTVLVNADDDRRLLGYYPTLAGETETYLSAKAAERGPRHGRAAARALHRRRRFAATASSTSLPKWWPPPSVEQLRARRVRPLRHPPRRRSGPRGRPASWLRLPAAGTHPGAGPRTRRRLRLPSRARRRVRGRRLLRGRRAPPSLYL